MSPRAAWRLESLGFTDVYDFVPSKMAWMAMGWGREGSATANPTAGEVARREVPTCRLDDTVADAKQRAEEMGYDFCLVTNDEGIFMGRLRGDAFSGDGTKRAGEAMEGGSTTTRPSSALKDLIGRMTKHGVKYMIISDLQGRLMGALMREDVEKALEAQQSDDS